MDNIILTNTINEELFKILNSKNYDKIFILCDTNTYKYCLSYLDKNIVRSSTICSIPDGEINKNVDNLQFIWHKMFESNLSRNSILINLGGGLISDIGGFAAATYKRGIDYINLPTSLMAMIDASLGGKTGINFYNYKNQIGIFAPPQAVIIFPKFLNTLPQRHILNGFAEMIKHSILDNFAHWQKISSINPQITNIEIFQVLLKDSIEVKKKFIQMDPTDLNDRQALNFGHTFGHAFETYFLNKNINILHGEAVVMGIICEIYLSNIIKNFNINHALDIVHYIAKNYQIQRVRYEEYETIFEIMTKDKKNAFDNIYFSLLSDFGVYHLKQTATKSQLIESLNFLYQLSK